MDVEHPYLLVHAGEFVSERYPELMDAFHKRMFKAYFDELADIGTVDAVVKLGAEAGLPEAELRAALEGETYRDRVDEGIDWARQVGVSAVPTFTLDEKYAGRRGATGGSLRAGVEKLRASAHRES